MESRLASFIDVFDENTAKGRILRILAKEWPLSARKIHIKIIQQNPATYHAIYKAINQMVKDGILRKQYIGYMISVEWLESVDNVFKRMKESSQSKSSAYLPNLRDITQEGENRTIVFENLEKADNYRKSLQEEYANMGDDMPYIGTSSHIRSPLLYTEKSKKLLDFVVKQKMPVFILCDGNTPLDEWCADYYRTHFIKVKTGMKNLVQTCETMILGNFVVQTFIPDTIKKKIDDIYSSSPNTSAISIPDFYSGVCLEKADVTVVITRNRNIAEHIRQNSMNHFKTKSISVFSINGNLVNYTFSTDLTEFLQSKGILNSKEGLELIRLGKEWKKGSIPWDVVRNAQIKYYPKALEGKTVADVEAAIKEFVEDKVTQFIFKNSAKVVSLARSYTKTMAVTRLPEEFIRGLEPFLIFDEIIATEFEKKNGKYTGRSVRNLNTEATKEKAFLAWMQRKKFDSSFGFGNSESDIGFLKHVSVPIVIRPHKILHDFAKQKKWKYFVKGAEEGMIDYTRKLFTKIQ